MAAHRNVGAAAPGPVTPATSDNARGQAGAVGGQEREDRGDFRWDDFAAQAALRIEGEDYARAYLDRLRADTARPGELAVLVAFLSGEMLHGACRLIEKTLRGGGS